MNYHIDPNDPKYQNAASQILARHNNNEAEANITSAVRDFLIVAGLAKAEEIVEETPPSDTSRRAVDLTALDTFVEMKRRVGTTGGNDPNPEYIGQLDDYLLQSQQSGRGVRMGILTDGKHWLLRWPGAGAVKTSYPYAFTLETPDHWLPLFEWLRDRALVSLENIPAGRESIQEQFGPNSPSYQRDIAALKGLYQQAKGYETIKVKRTLWHDLLRTALGEIARSPEELDDLFIRHTYLSAVIGMVVQASFGIDIDQRAANDPADLLHGRRFYNTVGLQGIVESDFFAWPTEVGGLGFLKTLAHRVARFDWGSAPTDIAAILYETVIPAEERRQLGEYYTPDWLARTMVEELVTAPLNQRVLDPACGSGTFIAEAVRHFIDAAGAKNLHPKQVLDRLWVSVTGIDVHPVAVHLARAAWALAARPAIEAAEKAGFNASMAVPVYLGDSLQLRFRTGDMFAEQQVTIQVQDEANTELVFPVSLVDRAEDFDSLMGHVAEAIEKGEDPYIALDDNGITDSGERETLTETIGKMEQLHSQGRDHIWAYYTRNLVRPVALGRNKVDVIVGNPPWLNYNQTADTLRTELENQSKNLYGIWAGGRYATHQDVAGLFFARCTDLYLKVDGVIGFVMPHSALQTGQYSKWRTGRWETKNSSNPVYVDFGYKMAWDLERLQPNNFFPVPASVVFARRRNGTVGALEGEVERWLGPAGAENPDRTTRVGITDTSEGNDSPYYGHSRLGAILYPRCLLFVEETVNPAIIQAGQTVTVNPRRGAQDKKPWRNLDLTIISDQPIETRHLFDIYLGESVAPYSTLDPLNAVLPFKKTDFIITINKEGIGGLNLGSLDMRMRERWRNISNLWEENKSQVNKLNLLGQFDYWGHLSAQLEWKHDPKGRPIRVVYTKAGAPTAARLHDNESLVDHKLFWIGCRDVQEANYLLAIINSDVLSEAVAPLMAKGQFGARDLQKHLWKLPIPEFDSSVGLHVEISEAGAVAAKGAAERLERLREEREKVTVTVARREIRKWLRESEEGRAVEDAVGRLLGSSDGCLE